MGLFSQTTTVLQSGTYTEEFASGFGNKEGRLQGILKSKHGADFANCLDEQVPRRSFNTVLTFPFSNWISITPF